MIKVGLTGSIGMGKSTTANIFRQKGIPVYDADATVHRLYENEAVPLIDELFPGTAVNGRVDREKLGAYVVGNDENMQKLGALVHPLVHAEEEKFLTAIAAKGADIVILDIEAILSRQLPDEQKREHADFIIDSGKGIEFAEEQVDQIIHELRNKSV